MRALRAGLQRFKAKRIREQGRSICLTLPKESGWNPGDMINIYMEGDGSRMYLEPEASEDVDKKES